MLGVVLAAAGLVLTACGDSDPTEAGATTTASASTTSGGETLVTAPESDRVDLDEPTFSDPTTITNPLFPITDVTQMVQLGHDEGESLRVEVTLLPETRTIEWNGRPVDVVVSQFVGYLDGRIAETALDYFAQADDGSVWYFGEDVDNYEDGVVENHEGSWVAGRDGPAGMIMPAAPQPGDVYRPENIPDLVFEEATVQSVDETVDGPSGPVSGAIVIRELLMDGATEDKVFAPGYGEFSGSTADEEFEVAVAVPTDAVGVAAPRELDMLASGAVDAFEQASTDEWDAASETVASLTAVVDALDAAGLPGLLADQLSAALEGLAVEVDARDPEAAGQAAIDTLQAALDLALRHREPASVDLDRMALWARQVQLDANADDSAGVAGDAAVLEAIWQRVGHTVEDTATVDAIDAGLADLRAAAADDDLTAAAAAATALLAAS